MTIISKYPLLAPNPSCMLLAGRFVPDGTNNPSTYVTNKTGCATVTYNSATGCWRVTINIPVSAIITAKAWVIDDKTQVQSYETNVVGFSNTNQTFDIELQYAADVNAGAYAADASVDYICWEALVNVQDLPGNGT